MTRLVSLTACAFFSLITSANSAIYTGHRHIEGNVVDVSVTTDNVIGLVSPTDITSFDIEISGPIGRFSLTPVNALIHVGTSELTATKTNLIYDFLNKSDGDPNYYFGFFGQEAPSTSYCLSSNCYIGAGETLKTYPADQFFPTVYLAPHTGRVIIATVAGSVSEPSSMLTMLGGAVSAALTGFVRRKRCRN